MFSENFTDYVKGFGGKFGVQTDRQDKCALGWDHQEKVQLHESQKGRAAPSPFCSFWLPSFWPPVACVSPKPKHLFGHSLSGAAMSLLFLCLGFAVTGWTGGCRAALAQLTPSPTKSRLRAKFSLYEPDSVLDYFPFSVELCKPQVRNSFLLSTNHFSLLDSVVCIPVFMQGESKTKCSPSSWPVGFLFLWNTWCPVKIQLLLKMLCLSLLLTSRN